ncbi:hypothetical protein K435DRAFT_742928 [Dendrothele bispora CBS 962.96]|uniref:SLC41A/MgtE integral membrane domain-containing protein n=1 Tax=Dendrothele bispora (strain CBS 962.96) TaxID=1314807 RepID=A0A4S8MUY6_DENBC|nr:hypothetical protein K435DRAFT_742928 [Dendrothele bispora CBS 962.96]
MTAQNRDVVAADIELEALHDNQDHECEYGDEESLERSKPTHRIENGSKFREEIDESENGIGNGNGHANGLGDEEDYSEDDEEALLSGGSRGRSRREARSGSIGLGKGSRLSMVWPQIRDIVWEAAPTLLLTTIGLLFTGELLDHVSRWRAMREVDQLIMIIPVVLNLKGNLEMNLSARLGTAANVGELDNPVVRRQMVLGNLTLLQVQATVVSFVAACVSFVLSFVIPRSTAPEAAPAQAGTEMSTRDVVNVLMDLAVRRARPNLPPVDTSRKTGFHSFVMVASTGMTAACLSGLVLGSFMCGLIVLCRYFGRDPDNIAPPVASCLGDLITLILVGLVSTLLIPFLYTFVPLFVIFGVLFSFFLCLANTLRNPYVKDLIKEGWTPLFGAMIISSTTGIVLDLFVSRYEGFALLAVVISGLPGAVGSIFISRLSTALHAAALPMSGYRSVVQNGGGHHVVGDEEESGLRSGSESGRKDQKQEPSPLLVMITLMVITLPVEVIFLSMLRGLGWLRLPFVFVASSVLFFCCAVLASLVIARYLTNFLWNRKLDPDMYALPIHSALMDLVGQSLLVLCFEIVSLLGGAVEAKPHSGG